MKILLSAKACNPYTGSEGYFGWAAVQCLAQSHDLWVMTGERNRGDLEKATAEGLVSKNIHFVYVGQFKEWHRNRLIARFQDWQEYADFSKNILPIAKNLHQTIKFDLVHHVTIATWRVASPLWQLNIPFVFGPIGGNEHFPFRFFPILSPVAMGFELLRMLSNTASRFSPSVRACMRHSSHIFVANSETEHLVKKMRGTQTGVSRLMANFHSKIRVKAFAQYATKKKQNVPLRLFAGGNLEGRKGVALALHALAQAKKMGVKFHYRLGGKGPEFHSLQNLAARLGIQNDVLLGDSFFGEEYRKELGETHIYLLPSLRDSAPVTLAEAMLAGCVPIVADCGGPGNIVTEDCGYKIPVSTRERMITEMANTIVYLDRNRKIISEKGAAAVQRIATNFTDENYQKTMNAVYLSVTKHAVEQNASNC